MSPLATKLQICYAALLVIFCSAEGAVRMRVIDYVRRRVVETKNLVLLSYVKRRALKFIFPYRLILQL